jgi:hypothetical protein
VPGRTRLTIASRYADKSNNPQQPTAPRLCARKGPTDAEAF